MTKQIRPTRFLWLDLEMTGLDPTKDVILEVAVIVTDEKYNEIAHLESTVLHEETLIRDLFSSVDFWKERPEAAQKIIEDSKYGLELSEVEAKILKLIEETCGESEVFLAGNSIRVDRSFIDTYWPSLSRRLHYRMLDVTSFKLAWLAGGGEEFTKKETHRALADIKESIAELEYYLAKTWPS